MVLGPWSEDLLIGICIEAVLLTGSCGARVGLCGCSGFTEAPEGGLLTRSSTCPPQCLMPS